MYYTKYFHAGSLENDRDLVQEVDDFICEEDLGREQVKTTWLTREQTLICIVEWWTTDRD
jgi:hypothetical protein